MVDEKADEADKQADGAGTKEPESAKESGTEPESGTGTGTEPESGTGTGTGTEPESESEPEESEEDRDPPTHSESPKAKAKTERVATPVGGSLAAAKAPVHPLMRFDLGWTKLEARLATAVLFAEIAALCLWVTLKGMSSEYKPGLLDAEGAPVPVDVSGLVYRCVVLAVVFGLVAHRLTRGRQEQQRTIAVTAGIVVGLGLGRAFASTGSEYFSNLLNWMQTASMLTLFGGLRGLATRLTLWLALLGGSLATGQGKHINVDVAMRFLPVKLRVPVAVLGWMTAALVCASGAYGFFDHIAIEGFKVRATVACPGDATKDCDKPAGDKVAEVKKGVSADLFLFGRQLSLDTRSLGVVIGGHDYNTYLKARDWNEWLAGGDWTAHFAKEDVDGQRMDESDPNATRLPMVNVPGTGENTSGLLVRDLNFIFPFGLVMIALRFVLRSVLAILGLVKVDPDAAHGDADIEAHHKTDADAGEVAS